MALIAMVVSFASEKNVNYKKESSAKTALFFTCFVKTNQVILQKHLAKKPPAVGMNIVAVIVGANAKFLA